MVNVDYLVWIVLVDDQHLVLDGLAALLRMHPHLELCASFDHGDKAVEYARRNTIDIYVIDTQMPQVDGIETTARLRRINPEQKVMLLVGETAELYPGRLIKSGAIGFISKNGGVNQLYTAIEQVIEGHRYIGSDVAQILALAMFPGSEDSPLESLSRRELQVMTLVAGGEGVQSIAQRLALSPKTVATYRYRLYEKLAVRNDVELAHRAMQYGVVQLGECFIPSV